MYVSSQAGALSVTSSNSSVATASLSAVSNGKATLTVTPQGTAGTATVTVTEANGNETATFIANITAPNYRVSSGSPTYHMELATAHAAVSSGGTITVEQDVEDSSICYVTKDVTLDTNGHTVTRGRQIDVSGTLNITGTGTLSGNVYGLIDNNGGTVNLSSNATVAAVCTNSGNYSTVY